MTSEIQQLLLVKQLAQEAERQLAREDDFGSGLAVSLSQDAVELLIRVIVRTKNLSVAGTATINAMADSIDKAALDDGQKVPHRERIQDLNKARVSFKHLGTAPGRADAKRLVRYGVEFLEETCRRFFNMEYRGISLAHSVRANVVRAFLLEAERLLAAGDFQDALIEAADAVRSVEGTLRDLLPPPRSSSFGASADGERAGRALASYLGGLRLVALGALVGFDVRSLLRFRALAPNVHRSVSGDRTVTLTRGMASESEATFGVGFAIDFAIAVQTRLG